MRKLILLFFFLPELLFAQGFGGGVLAGLSTSQVTGDAIAGFNKVGFWGGAFTDYRFTPQSSLQFELSFIQKGSRQAPTAKNNGVLYAHNQNLLEVPLVYRWWGIKNMSLELGVQGAYMISSTERDNAGEILGRAPLRPMEASVMGGLSYYFWKGKIEANARYANSLHSLRSDKWWVNHVIAFSVRFWFKTTYDHDKVKATRKKNGVNLKIDTGKEAE